MGDKDESKIVSMSIVQFIDREIAAERRVMQERFDAVSKANDLAYVELQRRLDMLNHAHEEMTRDKMHFLPRETYDTFYEENKRWRELVNNILSNQAGRTAAYAAGIGLVLASIQIALHYWK
jgi:hypothetical protein